MKKIWILFLVVATVCPGIAAQSLSERYAPMLTLPKGYVCYRAADTLCIDGRADDPSWAQAPVTDLFVDISGDGFPRPRYGTTARMLWDDRYLYILADMDEPHLWATLTEHDCVVYADNDFEVFIDPEGEGHNYFEIETNLFGTIFDLALDKPYRASKCFVQVQWDCPGLKLATHYRGTLNNASDTDQGWTVEMAIPYQALGNNFGNCLQADHWLRINFSRVEWSHVLNSRGEYERKRDAATGKLLPEDNWVWSPTGRIAMHMPERWGYLYLSGVTAGEGDEAFRYPEDLPVYRFLWMLFYAQEEQYGQHRTYHRQLSDFGLSPEDRKLLPAGYRIEVETTRHTYEITATDPGGAQLVINEAGRCFKRRNTPDK
jgi:hypothetical protein